MICFLSYPFVSRLAYLPKPTTNTRSVFGPAIDVLGMVIYGTELVLWLGVFVCGGIFNLLPWLRERSRRVETPQEPIALHTMPSSTSVFRTASGTEVVQRRGWPNEN